MQTAQSLLEAGPATTAVHSHFVYLYRDLAGRPVYVSRTIGVPSVERSGPR
jgi:hypothetical protein